MLIDTTFVIVDNKLVAEIDTTYIPKYDQIEYLSAKCNLSYGQGSWYGDTLAKHKVSLYELTSRMDPDINYTSDFNPSLLNYDPLNPIGELEYYIRNNQEDTLWSTSGYIHNLEISLNDEIGLRLYNAESETINDVENFKNLFNGIYATTQKIDESEGSLLMLNYRQIDQEISILYRGRRYEDDIAVYDTLSWNFPINIESSKCLKYERDYSNSNIDFTSNNTDKIYLQGMAGTRGKINITDAFVEKWEEILPVNTTEQSEQITSIASVELSLYVDTTIANFRDYLPDALNLQIMDDGELRTPSFQRPETKEGAEAITGGSLRLDEDGSLRYVFSFATGFFEEFIHPTSTVNDKTNFKELYLSIPRQTIVLKELFYTGWINQTLPYDISMLTKLLQ